MCKNAQSTAASLMAAIEPTLKAILSFTHLLNTPQGTAAIAAYDAALAAVQAWKSGTAAQNVLQLIEAFQSIFNALPLPSSVQTLANIILAGIETVIGVLTANSPAPAAVEAGDASAEETRAMHQAHVAAATASKVAELVPGFKRSIWHSPASQYQKAWDEAVENGGFPVALKV